MPSKWAWCRKDDHTLPGKLICRVMEICCCSALATLCPTPASRCKSGRMQSIIRRQSSVTLPKSRTQPQSTKMQFYLVLNNTFESWLEITWHCQQTGQPSGYCTIHHHLSDLSLFFCFVFTKYLKYLILSGLLPWSWGSNHYFEYSVWLHSASETSV